MPGGHVRLLILCGGVRVSLAPGEMVEVPSRWIAAFVQVSAAYVDTTGLDDRNSEKAVSQ